MANFDFSQLRQQTEERFSVLKNTAITVSQLLEELSTLWSSAEVQIEQHKDGDRKLIACAPGCQFCCVVNVSTTLLEGIAIARFLRQLDPAVLAQVHSRVDKLWRDVRGLNDEERLLARCKCAFLDDRGWCLIYPVRPLFCRSVTSTDVESCRAAVVGQVFAEVKPVMMHQFQLQLYKTLFAGVVDGLEQAGLDGRCFQLSGLIRYLLNHPDDEQDLLTESSLDWNKLYP
ncbi:Putative zinc-or iron-chelating domain-containing protein [Desulfuromusa kysingii]|uniref:Putative zinc-or iron-chelating domain-containing protein n=1 Tax=Desulfuromusa kysingii TaxID=37625 RepID=A0A1H4C811_9BACT|nr:YkgJ family cysteine cluster protein [Desulfuromusa kysingii]SEA56443.1 Putative zinc-or iron-chelating domain-containing protein [Desulfuromusa kysingii]